MQVLRILTARRPRRAVPTTITALSEAAPADSSEAAEPEPEPEPEEEDDDDDEGPFFDLDFSSVRASSSSTAGSASSSSASGSSGSDESDDAFTDLDFIISLHRTRSAASPASYSDDTLVVFRGLAPPPPPLLKLRASLEPSSAKAAAAHGGVRALSFGASSCRKAAFYGGRPSSARSSSSTRSLRLFMDDDEDGVVAEEEPRRARAPAYSRDAIRRYLTKISRRLRRVRGARDREPGPLRRPLRKSRSASAATAVTATPSRRDDSLAEKQDGIASAIAHCKESLHRASLAESDSPLLRSRSDPGKS